MKLGISAATCDSRRWPRPTPGATTPTAWVMDEASLTYPLDARACGPGQTTTQTYRTSRFSSICKRSFPTRRRILLLAW